MFSSLNFPLAAGLFGLGVPELLIIMVVLTVLIGLPIAILAIVFAFRRRQDELWHETARIALEKGQPLPPQILLRPESGRNDLRAGLVLVATGAALWFFLGYLGAIPGFIGVALLLNWTFERIGKSRASVPENRPPSPPA